MSKIQLNLVLSCLSPKRWKLLTENGQVVGNISYKTKRQFYLTDKWLNKEKDLDEVLAFEKQIIRSQFLEFLSKSEKSPQKAKDWLSKRAVKKNEISELLQEAENKGFISIERYTELKLKKESRKGNKPLWKIKLELQNQGISPSSIKLTDYNENEALKSYIYKNFWKLNKDKDKFIKRLMARGFNYSSIMQAIQEINNEDI